MSIDKPRLWVRRARRAGLLSVFTALLVVTTLTASFASPVHPAVPNPGPGGSNAGSTGSTGSAAVDGASSLLPSHAFGSGIQTVLLLGLVSIAPFMLVMMTAFTRIVVVLGLTRSALNTPSIPPTPVIIGLALFLTAFVMGPTFATINTDALQPYLAGHMSNGEFFSHAIGPLRDFMFAHTREKDLGLFVKMQHLPQPHDQHDVATTTLVPAFVISELRTAFLMGFVIYIPFIVIDLIVSAVLSSVGMVMLPPVLVSLPFKLLLFVAADGWYLIVNSIVSSYR